MFVLLCICCFGFLVSAPGNHFHGAKVAKGVFFDEKRGFSAKSGAPQMKWGDWKKLFGRRKMKWGAGKRRLKP
jgi:hypothetical protein